MEVFRQGFGEVLFLHDKHQLLHSGGALAVGDAVEDGFGNGGVRDGPADGVGGDHLVFGIAPALATVEGGEARVVLKRGNLILNLLKAEIADEISKALIKPEIIPPFHSHKIAKPVMRQLMRNGIAKLEHPLIGNLLLEHIQVIKSNDTGILHRTPLVLVSEDLLVLVEGERIAEEGLVEFHGFDGDVPDERRHFL